MQPSLAALFLSLPLLAHAQSSIDPAAPYAYSANAGWINLRADGTNGVRVGECFLSGKAYAANFGWIDFGDGDPADHFKYGNNSATDFGVNHDGDGSLDGYAYAANVGWISFHWAHDNPNDPNRPRFDLATGTFAGYAYAANLGWINLGTGTLRTATIAHTDSDGDGIDDAWEYQYFLNLTDAGIGTDRDGDGQSDAAEYIAGTNPFDADDYLKIVSHTYANGQTTATIAFTSNPMRRYKLEHSTDLVTWTDSGLGTFSPDSGATTTRAFSYTGATRHFFRAVAVLPLQQP